ncbi:OmpP1/FadL family transporter [Limnoglobus roseus]|uniref:OmpP1/FadL family transporter n=1 Tax=Limnoglobus roseus TaxID=2598579 RepID=UPI00143CD0FB|nr:outer membrane protein transport protein [Limnoglobus roseus]
MACLILASNVAVAQYGPIITASGPVNRSMGGVAVATPLSPSSATYWNPATLSGFDRSQVDFGAEMLLIDSSLASRFAANAFGAGVPPIPLAGQTKSNSTVYPLPNAGLVYRPEDQPRLALGMSLNAVAGFGVDYPGSQTNPILSPRAPVGVGAGPIFSDYQVLQINPAASYQLTDRLSVGGGPTIDLGRLQFNPGQSLRPDDANGDGFANYPSALQTRNSWGAGFILGLYYRGDTWATGFSYKSTQWSEPFRYNTTDEIGRPRNALVHLELPMLCSWGLSYTGFDRWVLSTDLRYLNYANARGYGGQGFTGFGSAAGLGFENVFAVAVGAQYRATDRLTLRSGYSYGSNPIPDGQTSFNLASSTIIEHTVTVGASWAVTDSLSMNVAYLHGFKNSITGPLVLPAGAVPGTSLTSSVGFDSIAFGASVAFGPTRRPSCLVRSNATTEIPAVVE